MAVRPTSHPISALWVRKLPAQGIALTVLQFSNAADALGANENLLLFMPTHLLWIYAGGRLLVGKAAVERNMMTAYFLVTFAGLVSAAALKLSPSGQENGWFIAALSLLLAVKITVLNGPWLSNAP